MKLLCAIGILVFAFVSQDVLAKAAYRRLIKKLRNKLDPDVIPFGKNNEAVNVSVSVNLIDITEANVNKNEMEIEVLLTESWNVGLSWSREKFNFSNVKIPTSGVWMPDIVMFNGYKKFENQAPPLVVVSDNGNAVIVIRTRMDAKCKMSAKHLATNQTCVFKMGSWTNNADTIFLQEPHAEVDVSNFDSPKYTLLKAKLSKVTTKYPCCVESYESYELSISFAKKDRRDRSSAE